VVERALLGALRIRIHSVALAVEMAAAAHKALVARSRGVEAAAAAAV
jgi:hypothetical protein